MPGRRTMVRACIQSHPNLLALRLCLSNGDFCQANALRRFLGAVARLRHLRRLGLNLSRSSLRSTAGFYCLRTLLELQSFDLDLTGNTKLGVATGHAVARLLTLLPTLSACTLRLAHTSVHCLPAIGGGGPNALEQLVVTGSHLNVAEAMLCAGERLRTVDIALPEAALGDGGCRRLATLLSTRTGLRSLTLTLAGNNIVDSGLEALLNACRRTMPFLQHLSLDLHTNHGVTVAGLHPLQTLLQRLGSVRLDLSHCGIRPSDTFRLAHLLSVKRRLRLRDMQVSLLGTANSAADRARMQSALLESWRPQAEHLSVFL